MKKIVKRKKKKTPKGRFWVLLACLLWGWGAGLWWRWITAPPLPDATLAVRMEIAPDTPVSTIAAELENQGVIRSRWVMRQWLRAKSLWQRKEIALQAGVYDFPLNQSLPEVVQQLQQGKVATNSFTIPEGWSLQDMANFFARSGYFSADQFLAATRKETATQWPQWLPANVESLEGFLFPDTYEMPLYGATPQAVVTAMTDRFAQVALPLYQQNSSAFTLQEWVTLASIVEKEAVIDSERPTIAGVFGHRLQKKMRLESDPTVEYAFNIRQTPENPLTLQQVRTPSPYNTYLNAGLPPGPIAAPGLASLQVSLAPPKTDYLFFVARYDGSHVFSRTLEEHELAIAKIAEKFPQPSP